MELNPGGGMGPEPASSDRMSHGHVDDGHVDDDHTRDDGVDVMVHGAGEQREAPALSAGQRRVVEHASGPLLVLGGPGSGKTTALVEAAARVLREGALPPLVLTYSRRAAVELRTRITARSGRSGEMAQVFTVHGLCLSILRQPQVLAGDSGGHGEPPRLLTAPQQEFRVRELLAVDEPGVGVTWPETVQEALPTQAFAAELRTVIARARQLGMDGADLAEVGERAGRPEWVCAGAFMEEYLEVLGFENAIDYPELVHRARLLLADDEIAATVRGRFGAVFVDEFQELDAAQVSLLQQLVGTELPLVVAGDPDQSIFGFRGSDPRAILDFCQRFGADAGEPAPTVALGASHRLGQGMTAVASAVASRLPLPRPVPGVDGAGFRVTEPATDVDADEVRVDICDSVGAEAEHIADVLRQAHLRDGIAWADMAVLARSGRRTLPGLARALTAAGVPVEVAGDEIALAGEPAVRPLLWALDAVMTWPDVPHDKISDLLTSPLGGLDALDLRRLGRRLRAAQRAVTSPMGTDVSEPVEEASMSSTELIARLVTDPDACTDLIDAMGTTPRAVARAVALGRLLRRAHELEQGGAHAEDVLWELWRGTTWPDDLRRAALHQGRLEGADRANRDLDAVVALFDLAKRSAETPGRGRLQTFLAEVEAQQIPADTQREGDVRGVGVRLMTAHRAKGREWELVVVASVQDGAWPDLRRQGSLLEADRLGTLPGADGPVFGLADPASVPERLAEERRLFFVAVTRARRRLVVTAVQSTEDEPEQPSRFIDELGVEPRYVRGRPTRPLALGALVAELRRVASDPEATPGLRQAAAARLARLADAGDEDGRPVAPGADPASWWGMRELTRAQDPLIAPGRPVSISPSTLSALLACPRQWFLSRRAKGEMGRSAAANTGNVVHALLEHAENLDIEELHAHLDAVWGRLTFASDQLAEREQSEIEAGLERFARWRRERTGTLLGTELEFRVPVQCGSHQVMLSGKVDRLEQDPDGALRVIDFKTGRTAIGRSEVPGHEQLGVYQLAVQQGAFDDHTGGERRVAGAELVYLRVETGSTGFPTVRIQESLDRQPHLPSEDASSPDDVKGDGAAGSFPTWVHEKLSLAATRIMDEDFPATPGGACRHCAFWSSCPAKGAEVIG